MNKELYEEMKREYAKAERYWMLSAMTPSEIVESRRNFVMMYEPCIAELYEKAKIRADLGRLDKDAFIATADKDGITELLKDYRSFKDPNDRSMDFLCDDDPQIEGFKEGRAAEYRAVEARRSEDDYLREQTSEFHRWMMRNCDKSGGKGAEFRGAGGSVRAFAENFMKQDPKDQLKAMYILEKGLRHENRRITDEEMEGYKPDIKKLKSQMVSTRWKFWQRISSSQIYWQKLKECMDKAQRDKTVGPSGIGAEEITGGTTETIMHGVNALDGADTVMKTAGKAVETIGTVSTALWGAKNVMSSATKVISAVKNHETMTALQKAETAADVVVSGGNAILANSKYAIEKIPGVSKNLLGKSVSWVGVGAMAYWTVKSGVQSVHSAVRAGDHKEIVKAAAALNDQNRTPQEKAEIEKLVQNSRVIHTVNKQKALSHLVDCGFNSVFFAASLTGIVASATVATAFSGAGVVVIPASIAVANKMKAVEAKKVIDTKLYADKDEKKAKVDYARFILGSRYAMLGTKLKAKYHDMMNNHFKSESSILNSLRKKAVGNSGEVNNEALRNKIISDIGNDAYDRLHGNYVKEKEGKLNHFDKQMGELTIKLVNSAKGKVDKKQINKVAEDGRDKAVQSMLTAL